VARENDHTMNDTGTTEASGTPPGDISDTPVIVLRAGVGDPISVIDAYLLKEHTAEILDALVDLSLAKGADDARIYLGGRATEAKPEILGEAGRLEQAGIVLAQAKAAAGSADADAHARRSKPHRPRLRLTLYEATFPLVCAEVTAFVRAAEGGRPVPEFAPVTTGTGLETPLLLEGRPVIVTDPAALTADQGLLADAVFTLAGDVEREGVVVAPTATTLRELVFDHGGGVAGGRGLKAVVVGGPTGGLVPPSLLDLPATDDALRSFNVTLGSGTIEVVAEPACAVDRVRRAMHVISEENCGKCVVCREGSMQMAEILAAIGTGAGRPGDIGLLLELARALRVLGTCGWGRAAASPVLSALAHFPGDLEAHLHNKACPAGVCGERAG
jgi:NADH:ubiquinone oxidoreductase subunit F (NADH-binding)